MEPARSILVRAAVAIFGAVLLLLGVAGLALPFLPGWVLIFAGLAVLAGEFVWARRLLDGVRERVDRVRRPQERRDDDPSEEGPSESRSKAS